MKLIVIGLLWILLCDIASLTYYHHQVGNLSEDIDESTNLGLFDIDDIRDKSEISQSVLQSYYRINSEMNKGGK